MHRLSLIMLVTVRVARTAFLALAVGLGCGNEPSDHLEDDLQLLLVEPLGSRAELRQGDTRPLSVRYQTALGEPRRNVQVGFVILGNAKGSTLSAEGAKTDASGLASVELRAGPANTKFSVQITAPGGSYLGVTVTVADFDPGTLLVRTGYDGALSSSQVKRVDVLLYESPSCSELDIVLPSPPLHSSTVGGVGVATRFSTLNADSSHSLLGRGFDAQGQLRMSACVDLPPGLLSGGQPVSFDLVLGDVAPRTTGRYTIDTEIALKTPVAPLATILETWTDLSDCEFDPAQLLLDCVVDAVDNDDPLDCLIPGDDTSPLTADILAQRGTLVASCRTSQLGNGSTTLDKRISDLMSANGAKMIAAIKPIPQAVEDALSRFHLTSSLEMTPTQWIDEGPSRRAAAAHRLEGVTLSGRARQASYPMSAIVATRPQAPAGALLDGWTVSFTNHALTLRLDSIARAALQDPVLVEAFEDTSFATGDPPSNSRAVVQRLAELVEAPPAAPGCDAISQLVCGSIGRAADCLTPACTLGLGALATYLDSGFVAAATPGVDLRLTGRAPLVDLDGDLRADLIGSDPQNEHMTGTWTEVQLWLGGEEVSVHSATFQGERLPPPQD